MHYWILTTELKGRRWVRDWGWG